MYKAPFENRKWVLREEPERPRSGREIFRLEKGDERANGKGCDPVQDEQTKRYCKLQRRFL